MHFPDIYVDEDRRQALPICTCKWVGRWDDSEDGAYDQWEYHRMVSLFDTDAELTEVKQ